MKKLLPTRRRFLGTSTAALAAAGLGAPAVHAQARTVRVGYVTPQTGPLAAFAEVDGFIIDGFGPNGIAARVMDVTRNVVKLQTGYVYHYAFAMLIGVAAFVTYYSLTGAH